MDVPPWNRYNEWRKENEEICMLEMTLPRAPEPVDAALLPALIELYVANYRTTRVQPKTVQNSAYPLRIFLQWFRGQPDTMLDAAAFSRFATWLETAKGIVFMSLEDESGLLDIVAKPQVWERLQDVLRHESLILAEGTIQRADDAAAVSLLLANATPLHNLLTNAVNVPSTGRAWF